MSNIRLSFIVPVYQVAQYLDECLASISAQSLEDMEVWVVDDGSTDGSAEICDKWAEKDCRFHVEHTLNQGVSMARNLGMEKASGEWICFVDGDDWIEKDFTKELVFDHYKDADIVLFGRSFVNGSGKVHHKQNLTRTGLQPQMAISHIISHILDIYTIRSNEIIDGISYRSPWGKMYRADFLKKNHLKYVQGQIIGEDTVLNLDAFLCGPRLYGSTIMEYCYRENRSSVSYRYNNATTDAYQRQEQEIKNVLLKHHRMRDYQEQLYAVFIESLLNCTRLDYCHPDNPLSFFKRRADFLKLRNTSNCDMAFQCVDLSGIGYKTQSLLKYMQRKNFLAVDIWYKLSRWYRCIKRFFQHSADG